MALASSGRPPDSDRRAGETALEAGEYERAERLLRSAASTAPEDLELRVDLARACMGSGRLDEASRLLDDVLRHAGDHPAATLRRGTLALLRGEAEEAETWFRRAAALDPENAQPTAGLALVMETRGRRDAAHDLYLRATKFPRRTADAWHLLGRSRLAQGETGRALQALERCLELEPRNARARADWLLGASRLQATPRDRRFADRLLDALENRQADVTPLVAHCLRIARDHPGLSAALEALGSSPPLDLLAGAGVAGRLLRMVLREGVVTDEWFESGLVRLRSASARWAAGLAGDSPPATLDTLVSLAIHCFRSGFVYPVTRCEDEWIESVLASLEREPPASFGSRLAVVAAYRPLISALRRPPPRATREPELADLLRVQWDEPLEETRLARTLRGVGASGGPSMSEVRAQYESHPYPPWHRLPREQPLPATVVLRRHLATAAPQTVLPERVRVLVAGCGTGRHALIAARRYRHRGVVALDVSRSSLAYAMRRAAELGFREVTFFHADLLDLGGWEERFDVIECAGVLHHLDAPEEGLAVLARLLARGGVMKLGLYSRRARRHVQAARRLLEERGLTSAAEDVSRARQVILGLPGEDPARRVVGLTDFYTMSGCVDLLFHCRERLFSPLDLAAMLERAGLRFLGFVPQERIDLAAYDALFPQDPRRLDLGCWDAFEAAYPDSFLGMYQFWCCARDGRKPGPEATLSTRAPRQRRRGPSPS